MTAHFALPATRPLPLTAAPTPISGVSVCMIVRDEEGWLGGCLSSVRHWVDEICVLDTGSTDRSVEIARSYGAIVRQSEWQDDFSAARNQSLALATQPWILVIDADEELSEQSGKQLRKAIESRDQQGWLVYQDNLLSETEIRPLAVPRLFRNRPEIRFRRRVHESVMESLIALGVGELPCSDIHLIHHGYLPKHHRKRSKQIRNLALLRRCQEEDPHDLFVLHKLAASLRRPEERRERLLILERALRQIRPLNEHERRSYPFLPLVYDGLAEELCRVGRLEQAITIIDEGLIYFPTVTELRYRRGDLARRVGSVNEARKWLASCVGVEQSTPLFASDPATRGIMPLLGLVRQAFASDRQEEARVLVQHAVSLKPHDRSVRRLDIEVKLANRQTIKEGVGELERLIEDHPSAPEVFVISGQFAWTEGEEETAIGLWRRAAESEGDVGLEARCLLVLALLRRGEVDEALEYLPRLEMRDLQSATCRLVLSVIAEREIELDRAFERDGVTQHLVVVLRELLAGDDTSAVTRFAANAARYEGVLPGIGRLLVDE